jgi:ribose/xylose/arabinose/galactoside ABC-type transport system permease subunit
LRQGRFSALAPYAPLLITLVVFVSLYAGAGVYFRDEGFLSLPVFELLFSNKAALGIMSLGMTFVILTGGIDLSVGSVMALSTMVVAIIASHHLPALLGMLVAIGLFNGALIEFFEIPSFLVTLATLFLARGIAQVLNNAGRIALDEREYPFFGQYALMGVHIAGVEIYLRSIVLVALAIASIFVLRATRFGRNVYAIGGNEHAARLMGLPVTRTKISVYVISGFLAALAGVINLSASPAGDPVSAVGWELDAIVAVVIGGTLLTGGVGSATGTLLGVLIISLIDQINFSIGADPSVARIINGLLLFAFITLQKVLPALQRLRKTSQLT